jgi:phosphatidylserine decarboxylase
MRIHKEGRRFLLILFIILNIVNVVVVKTIDNHPLHLVFFFFSALIFAFCLQFFRNPTITVVKHPKFVLAPADGKVVVIEETIESEYFGNKRVQVSIFMSPVNKHVNRNPVSGTIKYLKYHAGKYLVAWHPKASTENERTSIVYEMDNGTTLLIRQIAGAMARRIKYYITESQRVEQGDEFGFIKFGSRVDVFLPIGTKISVSINDKTLAGKTVIAELI